MGRIGQHATHLAVELLVPCTREAADRIQSFIQQLETDLPDETRRSVGFHELLLNGIEWGGQLNPARKVRVACLHTRRMLLYRIADPGTGFKFDELSHAAIHGAPEAVVHDVVRNAKGLRPGGFGLVLIRAIADDLIYNERQNEVVFVKYLDEPCGGRAQAADSRRRDDRNNSDVARYVTCDARDMY